MSEKNDAEKLLRSRGETRAAFENRALLYAYILDEMESEIGLDDAVDAMKRAIYRRGLEIGEKYRVAASAGDLDEIGRLFVTSSPCEGALFHPSVEEPAEGGVTVLRMDSCPLVDAWRQAGYDAERVDILCEIAAAVDEGTFEGAGLQLRFLDRQGCATGETCLIELRAKSRKSP